MNSAPEMANGLEMRRRREALSMVLEDLAPLIGVRPSTLSKWERGKVHPHRNQVRRWRETLEGLEEKDAEDHGVRINERLDAGRQKKGQ